jgi:ATP-dependent DNA helicase PIF1
MSLNAEQSEAYERCITGQSVLLTGAGGVGKSFTIRRVCSTFEDMVRPYAITASTGAAAVLIEGMTIHRWAGIGLGTATAERLAHDILFSPGRAEAKRHWQTTRCLIIDEISMIDAQLFDKLEHIARIVRNNHTPFGGMQLIVCGDFAQLPPVKAKGGFAFQAKSWPSVIDATIELTQIVRQSEESFRAALNEIRFGKVSKTTIDLLRSRVGAEVGNDLIKPTMLLSKRKDVKRVNEEHLARLEGAEYVFDAADKVLVNGVTSRQPLDDETRIKLNRDMQARERVTLKVGAQVMLIFNHSNELVNGSRGVVTGIRNGMPLVQFLNGTELVIQRHTWKVKLSDSQLFVRTQIPLMLAYAVTQHKAQGSSLDCVDIDISNCFEAGQAYVALSRVRTLQGLRLRKPDLSRIIVHPEVKRFYGR